MKLCVCVKTSKPTVHNLNLNITDNRSIDASCQKYHDMIISLLKNIRIYLSILYAYAW